MSEQYPELCPKCKASFQGKPIPEKDRKYFGKETHFSRVIGVEDPRLYDGILWWRCPDCGHQWDREGVRP